jgi:hypothetical protein
MLPLYFSRIEDVGQGDLVKVDCAACHDSRLARAGAPPPPRPQPLDQGARPQRAGPVPAIRNERTGGNFDQVGAGRERVSRPLLPAPSKASGRATPAKERRRVAAPRPSSRPAAPKMSALVQIEATRSGSRSTRGEHRGILDPRSPAGPPQTIVKLQGGASAELCRATTVRPPAEGDGTSGMRDRDRLDRRQNARGHRDNADRSGRVHRLYTVVEDDAEAGVRLGAAPWAGCRALD